MAQANAASLAKTQEKTSQVRPGNLTLRSIFLAAIGVIVILLAWWFWRRQSGDAHPARSRQAHAEASAMTAFKCGVVLLLIAGTWNAWIAPSLGLPTSDRGVCLPDSNACLSKPREGGLIKSVPTLRALAGDAQKKRPHIPCGMVGVWSTIQRRSMFRITLNDDGSYIMDPNLAEEGNAKGYQGHWMVQSKHLVWRHDSQDQKELDINPILAIDDNSFELSEADGKQTRFELIRKIDSNNCMAADGG